MVNSYLKSTWGIINKEFHSEFISGSGISSLLLFALASIFTFALSTQGQIISEPISSAVIWIIILFQAITGLSRSFVREEERNTAIFLKLIASPSPIFFAKLIYNSFLNIASILISIIIVSLFLENFTIRNFSIFSVSILLGSLSITAVCTILSALVAKTNMKSGLLPVLAIPVILPALMLSIDTTKKGLEGWQWENVSEDMTLIFSFAGVIITISWLIFDKIWEE